MQQLIRKAQIPPTLWKPLFDSLFHRHIRRLMYYVLEQVIPLLLLYYEKLMTPFDGFQYRPFLIRSSRAIID